MEERINKVADAVANLFEIAEKLCEVAYYAKQHYLAGSYDEAKEMLDGFNENYRKAKDAFQKLEQEVEKFKWDVDSDLREWFEESFCNIRGNLFNFLEMKNLAFA